MVDPTSCAALDLVWDTLDATIVLGQGIIQPALRTLPTSSAPRPAPSIHASREINHRMIQLVTAYQFYLTVHILAAVVWVGGAAITQVYAARAMADPSPERLAGFARDTGFVGKTMFTPASLVLVVFGFLLVSEGNWSLGSAWLIFALAVFAASFAVGVGFLAPESARIERAIELHGVGSTEATRRIERIFLVSRIELLFLMLVVVDMVVKPGL